FVWDLPAEAPGAETGVLLTHGAGGDCRGPGLVALARGLAALGYPAGPSAPPYRVAGPRTPPEAGLSAPAFAGVRNEARRAHPPAGTAAGSPDGRARSAPEVLGALAAVVADWLAVG